jgi:amino acid transporter
MQKQEQNPTNLTKAPVEHYWDWLLHEDDLFSNRINFFIVAESMLFIAFAINSYDIRKLTIIIGLTGILFVLIWLYVSVCQVYFLINRIKAKLEEAWPEYQVRKGVWLLGEPNIWLGIIFPSVLIVVWIFLMIHQ